MHVIPKLIHQLWIGPKPAPTNFMDSWINKNPGFKYIRWNEEEIKKRGIKFECQSRVDEMIEINGKADIMRWEILYEYGGVFLDADSICVEPIDDVLMNCKGFAVWEQEILRKGLVATGAMGFPPKHPLVKGAIEWIKANCVDFQKTKLMAWQSVGPGLLTRMLNTGLYNDITILPSYTFLPIHFAGFEYKGHGKIYAYQEWGSTKQNYEEMNNLSLPEQFKEPSAENAVSILITSLNTKPSHLLQCLDSIKRQEGLFHMEIVWINNGSDDLNTALLEKSLIEFKKTTRFTKIIYSSNDVNKDLGYSLNRGVNLCSNEIIIRMDSNDVMVSTRIQKQLEYMNGNPECVLCGAQVKMFKAQKDKIIDCGQTNHPNLDLDAFMKNTKNHWLMNQSTFCFRKGKIQAIGNYNGSMCEDFELILRVLKKYGKIFNMPDMLVFRRLL